MTPNKTISACKCECHKIVPDELNNCDCIKSHITNPTPTNLQREKKTVKATFVSRKFWFGKNEPVLDETEHAQAVNMYFDNDGIVRKRRGWIYFGDMVNELWRINKIAQKSGLSSDIIVRIPLRGRKPIFKKTLKELL